MYVSVEKSEKYQYFLDEKKHLILSCAMHTKYRSFVVHSKLSEQTV